MGMNEGQETRQSDDNSLSSAALLHTPLVNNVIRVRRRKARNLVVSTLLSIVTIGLLAAGCILFLRYYRWFRESQELRSKIQAALNEDAAISVTVLDVTYDSPSMSFAEYSDSVDGIIEQRQQLLIEIQSLYPDHEFKVRQWVKEFFNQENELNRIVRGLIVETGVTLQYKAKYVSSVSQIYTSSGFYTEALRTDAERNINDAVTDYNAVVDAIVNASKTGKQTVDKLVETESELENACKVEKISFSKIYATRKKGLYEMLYSISKHASSVRLKGF
jgi:hypothetical protein